MFLLKLLTAPEVAKILQVGKGVIYELIHRKKLKAYRLGERRIRVPEEAVKEYLENNKF